MGSVKEWLNRLSQLDQMYVVIRFVVLLLLWPGLFLTPYPATWSTQAYRVAVGGLVSYTALTFIFLLSLLLFPRHHRLIYFVDLPVTVFLASLGTTVTGGQDSSFYLYHGIVTAVYALYFSTAAGLVAGLISVGSLIAFNLGDFFSPHWYDFLIKTCFILGVAVVVGAVTAMSRSERREIKNLNEALEESNTKLHQRVTELHAISEMAMVIHATLDFDALAKLVLDLLQKVLNLRSCAFMIVDREKGDILFSATQGLPEKMTEGLVFDAVAGSGGKSTGKSLGEVEAGDRLYKALPVLSQENILGVLCTEAAQIDRFSEDDRVLLSAVASELAVAVENARLYELTKRLAITDELTGLYNYRYLQQRLQLELERARRYTRPLSLVMADLDDFKLYNDTYGHLKGDVVLAEVAELFRASCRELDVLARYGGEEFAFILPETDASGAFVVAEKIREATAQQRFIGEGNQRNVRLTASLGVASFPHHASDLEGLLREADDALYTAKTSGRNRVCGPKEEEPRSPSQS